MLDGVSIVGCNYTIQRKKNKRNNSSLRLYAQIIFRFLLVGNKKKKKGGMASDGLFFFSVGRSAGAGKLFHCNRFLRVSDSFALHYTSVKLASVEQTNIVIMSVGWIEWLKFSIT